MNIYKNVRKIIGAILLLAGVCQAQAAPSGDTVIDSWIAPFQHKQGSNAVRSTEFDPLLYGGNPTKCNSSGAPSWESTCPSNLLYTPNENTGGYQAFGIGLTNYLDDTYYFPICYFYYVSDGDGGYFYDYWCDWYALQVPAYTYGAATARIAFGDWDFYGSPWGSQPMSTIAFHANNTLTPYDLWVDCDPTWSGFTAPCNTSRPDSYGIGTDVGYEDKVLFQDVNCSLPTRSGGPSDANYNCFVRDGGNWYTDLPSPYPDTTASDSSTYYVPAIGTSNPAAINDAQFYSWWINFYQLNHESGVSHSMQHNSAVTTHLPLAPGCTGSTPWNCYFNVEQTRISNVISYP